jgi:hypothetical protein
MYFVACQGKIIWQSYIFTWACLDYISENFLIFLYVISLPFPFPSEMASPFPLPFPFMIIPFPFFALHFLFLRKRTEIFRFVFNPSSICYGRGFSPLIFFVTPCVLSGISFGSTSEGHGSFFGESSFFLPWYAASILVKGWVPL